MSKIFVSKHKEKETFDEKNGRIVLIKKTASKFKIWAKKLLVRNELCSKKKCRSKQIWGKTNFGKNAYFDSLWHFLVA